MKLLDLGTVLLALFLVVPVLITGATLTGNSQELCDRMGGVYTPDNNVKGLDVCPGGSWANLFRDKPAPR